MSHVNISELLPSELVASTEVRRLVDTRDIDAWLTADLPERVALVAREGGRMVGVVLAGARGETSCVTAFALHQMSGAPIAVAFLLLSTLAQRLGPVAFKSCAFALRRADLDVRQAIAAFGARSETPEFLVEAMSSGERRPQAQLV